MELGNVMESAMADAVKRCQNIPRKAVIVCAAVLLLGIFVILEGAGTTNYSSPVTFQIPSRLKAIDPARIDKMEKDQQFTIGQLMALRSMIGKLFCKTQDLGPNGGFCLKKEAADVGGNSIIDINVAQILAETFGNATVLDLGCGLGQYGKWFAANAPAIKWQGFDGAENVEEVTEGFVRFADLTSELRLPEVDWVMSIEVGEHIPKQFMDTFIDNVCRAPRKGVIISWARWVF